MYMIDLFTEIIIFVTKNSLDGVTFTVDDILKEGIIENSEAKIEENTDLKIVKLLIRRKASAFDTSTTKENVELGPEHWRL